MERIAREYARRDYTLRSGGADGADHAFEVGSDRGCGTKEIYLPWKGFNGNDSQLYLDAMDKQDPGIVKRAEEATRKLLGDGHWSRLSQGAKKLHTRNLFQIKGAWGDNYTDRVVCWTPNGDLVGGTATAIKLATELNIPVFNLGNPGTQKLFETMLGDRFLD
jgi:hypothetical protein